MINKTSQELERYISDLHLLISDMHDYKEINKKAFDKIIEHYFDYLRYGDETEVFTSLSISSMDMPEEEQPDIKDLGNSLYYSDDPVLVVYDKSKLGVLSRVEGYKDRFKVKCNGVDNLSNAIVTIVQDYGDPKYNAFVRELIEKFQRGCTGEEVFFEYEDVPDVQCKNYCIMVSVYLNDALKQARETPSFPHVENIVMGNSLRKINNILEEHNYLLGPYVLYGELATERTQRKVSDKFRSEE